MGRGFLFLGILQLCLGVSVFAETKAYFPFTGQQAMINMSSQNPMSGYKDPDPEKLFNLMNVPTEPSYIGNGRKIVSQDGNLNLVCAERNDGTQACTLVVNHVSYVQIDPTNQTLMARIEGPEAKHIYSLFRHNDREIEFHFSTSDNSFSIYSSATEFVVKYH